MWCDHGDARIFRRFRSVEVHGLVGNDVSQSRENALIKIFGELIASAYSSNLLIRAGTKTFVWLSPMLSFPLAQSNLNVEGCVKRSIPASLACCRIFRKLCARTASRLSVASHGEKASAHKWKNPGLEENAHSHEGISTKKSKAPAHKSRASAHESRTSA